MRITTKRVSNASGRGGVLAKGYGKQKTTPWDHSLSNDANHGVAAANLILAHGGNDLAGSVVANIDSGHASHTVTDANAHVFEV